MSDSMERLIGRWRLLVVVAALAAGVAIAAVVIVASDSGEDAGRPAAEGAPARDEAGDVGNDRTAGGSPDAGGQAGDRQEPTIKVPPDASPEERRLIRRQLQKLLKRAPE